MMGVNENIVEITDQNFADTIEGSTGLTMVDFWAEWCGPCRMVAPIVEALADDYSGNGVTVGKLDVDQNPVVTVRFAVRTIPSVLFFKDGEHVDTVVGMVPRPTLEAKLKKHM
jgi:thioredoxin 1